MPESHRLRSRLMLASALALVAAAALPGTASAQQDTTYALDPRLVPGVRIRTTLSGPIQIRVQGLIDSVLPRAFVVDTATRPGFLFISPPPELLPAFRQTRVRFEDIERLELSRGRNRQRGMVRWGLIGAAVGGAIYGIAGSPERNPTSADIFRAAGVGALVGGALGVTIGYVQGGERWESVLVPERRVR